MIAILFAAALAGSAPAEAAGPAADPAKAATPGKPTADDPLVCKSELKAGSRVRTRTCMLRSERMRLAAEHQKAFSEAANAPTFTDQRGETMPGGR